MSEQLKPEQRHFDVLRAAAALCTGRRRLPLLEDWRPYIEEIPTILRSMQARIEELESRTPPAQVPDGFVLVPRELLDRFPEINLANYGQDEVDALNAWGIEVVLYETSLDPKS